MKKYPNIYKLNSHGLICDSKGHCFDTYALINRRYVVARPLGFQSRIEALKIAWKVFTGKADAVIWPEDQ